MKIASIFLLLTAFAVLEGAGVSVEINGISNKIVPSSPAGLEIRPAQKIKKELQKYCVDFIVPQTKLSREWQSFEISFVPDKNKTVVVTLQSTGDRKRGISEWIEYDQLSVVNGSLHNLSFEDMSVYNELFRWRYYAKESEKINQKDAADGNNYVSVSRRFPIRQTLRVLKANQKVVIKFKARLGIPTQDPANKHFSSKQNAPKINPITVEISN